MFTYQRYKFGLL